MHTLLLFLILLFCHAETKASFPRGFSIDLIHRDSISSPFYNSSMTPSDRARQAALRSISRFDESKAQTDITHGRGDYLMKFSIGSPPVESIAVADTGSDLIWVPCLPCGNCDQNTAFDPTTSSTFKLESCSSQACNSLPYQNHACGNMNQCRYAYEYGDNTYTTGDLATESINFGSTNGQDVSFPASVFGCGYDNHQFGNPANSAMGIVGLGRGSLSLVSQLGDQLGHKFSYCLTPSSSSKLKFGSESTISGNGVVSTPLFSKDSTFYYLNLESIAVEQQTIQTGQTDGNIIIDSGTTLTLLERGLYNNFRSAVVEAIGVEAVQDPPSGYNLCYTSGSVKQFPAFVFHFTGADLALPTNNLFVEVDNSVCFTVAPTDNVPIYGNDAQVNFQVEYDLEGNKVSFAPADCTKQ